MRIAIGAVVCLTLGALLGSTLARREFALDPFALEGATATGSSPSAPGSGPRLTLLGPERFVFGMMDQNSTTRHVFEIKNDGDQPLFVRKLGTSCKCTTTGMIKERLAPQETAQITLEWTAKGMAEIFEQHAEFSTNDVRRPKFRLIVSGQIRESLRVEPSEAIFNRVSSQEPARTTVRILGVGAEPLQVTSHKLTHAPSAPFFSLEFRPLGPAELPPKSEYQSGVEMQVELKPGLPLGQLAQTIQITTNRNLGGTFDIPVYGAVVSDISLVGSGTSAEKMSVDLGSFASRQGAKSTVYLVVKGPHRDQTTLKIAALEPAAELTATLGDPIRENPQIVSYPVTLEVPPGTMPVSRLSAGSRVAVRIETSHPQVKELTFHVKYAVVD